MLKIITLSNYTRKSSEQDRFEPVTAGQQLSAATEN